MILVVDDEPDILALVRVLLEREGYSVIDAPNGKAALEVIGVDPHDPGAARPDLVILDIMMPVMDGYTFNMRLQQNSETRHIPVIVLTAKGDKMRDLFEIAPNVNAYIQKPFEPKRLKELIAGILSGKNSA